MTNVIDLLRINKKNKQIDNNCVLKKTKEVIIG